MIACDITLKGILKATQKSVVKPTVQIKAEIAEKKKLNEHSNECKGVQIETAANLVSANIIIHQMGIFKNSFFLIGLYFLLLFLFFFLFPFF